MAIALLTLLLPTRADCDGDMRWAAEVAKLRAEMVALRTRVDDLEVWRGKAGPILGVLAASGTSSSTGQAPETASGEPAVVEDVDRFEGIRRFRMATVLDAVRTTGSTPEAVRAEVRFTTHKKTGRGATYLMEFDFLHRDQPIVGSTRTIVLVDEKRLVFELTPGSRRIGDDGLIATRWTWVLTGADLHAVARAKVVEVRLGGYEFVLPRQVRASMAKTRDLMERALRKERR